MSDFAGLWRLDGCPIDAADLVRLGQGLEARGIGPARLWREGPVGLVHRQHRFTTEDWAERLPLVGPSGAVLVADTRLNDRPGLLRALDLSGEAGNQPDGALILRALERWGAESAVSRLQGEFALALWDAKARRLTLARDPAGYRTLFIHRSGRLIVFATRMRALLAFPEVPRDLDDRALADFQILNLDFSRPTRTLYRAIERLPMGHLAVLTAEDSRFTRTWTLPRPGTLRRATDADYEEEAREVLDCAIGDALRARAPVSACLTGGLDSAAVVAGAARRLAPAPLFALTRVPGAPTPPDQDGRYHNEAPRAQAMATHHANVDWLAIGNDDGDWGERDGYRWFLESGTPNRAPLNIAWFFPLYRFMAARGSQVLLTGDMGNAFFSDSGLYLLPELFLGLRWGTLATQLRALSRADGVGLLRAFKTHVLRPLEPLPWRLRRLGRPAEPWAGHSALNPAFAVELKLMETLDLDRYRMRVGGRPPSAWEGRRWLSNHESGSDAHGVLRAFTGIDMRAPLADRRVVEFFGALPLDQFLKNGVTRSLARRLLQDRAPPETVANRMSGKQNGDWFARMSAARPAMLADLARLRASPPARRVVDLERIQSLLDTWPQDATTAELRRMEYYHMVARGMEMARFLAWHDGGNL